MRMVGGGLEELSTGAGETYREFRLGRRGSIHRLLNRLDYVMLWQGRVQWGIGFGSWGVGRVEEEVLQGVEPLFVCFAGMVPGKGGETC